MTERGSKLSFVSSLIKWFRSGQERSTGPGFEVGLSDAEPNPVDLTGSDTIDLHTFRPNEIRSVVAEFLDSAVERGHRRVRIIHGKGIGLQRKIVASILEKHPSVISYSTAPDASGWGATVAELKTRGGKRAEGQDER